MTATECLRYIATAITGNDWSDWKTRFIKDSHLLAQREVPRHLFVAEYDDLIRVYDYPTYDDKFYISLEGGEWLIDGKQKLGAIRSVLSKGENIP